jgi:hypothetical protein
MLTNRTLARINNRPRKVGRLPLLAVGGGTVVLTALLYVFEVLPPFATLAVLGGGALVVLLLYWSQKSKTTISLSYKGNLDKQTSARFSEVRKAVEGLASSGTVWSFDSSIKRPHKGKAAAPIPSPERERARVGLLETPGISADVPVWGIEAGDESIFFFPEGTLIYRDDHYEPISYKSLEVAFASARFFEEEDLPEDARVLEKVWRFGRPDGTPDPRYKKDNVQIPVVLYSLLDLSGPFGLGMHLGVSNRRAAARFARTFGAEVSMEEPKEKKADQGEEHRQADKDSGRSSSKEGGEERRSAEMLEREARLASARRALGVSKGAGVEEVSAAYRKLARSHHPDKVANLQPKVREYSEQRMKEINAAYAEFKRQWNDPATEGARVG